MRRLLSLAIAIMAATLAGAQAQPGKMTLKPMIGFTVSTVSNADIDFNKVPGLQGFGKIAANPKVGLVIGGEAEWQLSRMFALSAGITYTMQGCTFDEWYVNDGSATLGIKDAKVTFHFLNIPILANVYVAKNFALKAGLQPQVLLKAKEKMTVYGIVNGYGYDEVGMSGESEGTNTFALALPIGLSYDLKHLVIEARYNFGLTDIFDDGDQKCSAFQFTIGYRIN